MITSAELVLGPLRQQRRSLVGCAIGLGAFIAVTIAFWPVFQGASGISEAIDRLPPAVIDAFGLGGFGTPAGYLRGNLYDLFIPLLMAIIAIVLADAMSAAEEDSGRLELAMSQPVTRQALLAGRMVALVTWLVILTLSLLLVQLLGDAVIGIVIDLGALVSTVVLCGLLAAVAGLLAMAIAGWLARPTLVIGLGIAATVAMYVMGVLFRLDDRLRPLADLLPWSWALGSDPLVHGAEAWRFVALVLLGALLAALAVAGFVRRDIRAG